MRAYSVVVSGPKFTKSLTSNVAPVAVDHSLFRFSLHWDIPELFVLKVDAVRNRAEFWTFWLSQILLGHPFQKLYPPYHTCLAPRCLVNFRKDIPSNREVVTNFYSILSWTLTKSCQYIRPHAIGYTNSRIWFLAKISYLDVFIIVTFSFP